MATKKESTMKTAGVKNAAVITGVALRITCKMTVSREETK